MRKYISEFGLNVYTSHKTIIPVEHLNKIDNDAKYHIYMILSTPRVIIKKDSLVVLNDGISFSLLEISNGEEKEYKIEKFPILQDIDHRDITLDIKYPYDQLSYKIDEEILQEVYVKNEEILKKNKCTVEEFINYYNTPIDAQAFLNKYLYKNGLPSRFEVLYVGQSYGNNGERLAQERLSSHKTLQKILTDCHSKYRDKRIFILLLEMTPILNTSFDGISKQYISNEEEENKHLENGIKHLPLYDQVINISEAALINYFKPEYNINFVENFPSDKHIGYKQYFDLDYNCLTVELDLEFDYSPAIHLFSSNNEIKSSFDFIEYDLFNEPNRKNMYDIFTKQNI